MCIIIDKIAFLVKAFTVLRLAIACVFFVLFIPYCLWCNRRHQLVQC